MARKKTKKVSKGWSKLLKSTGKSLLNSPAAKASRQGVRAKTSWR